MASDLDIYRTAKLLIDQHGLKCASEYAAGRISAAPCPLVYEAIGHSEPEQYSPALRHACARTNGRNRAQLDGFRLLAGVNCDAPPYHPTACDPASRDDLRKHRQEQQPSPAVAATIEAEDGALYYGTIENASVANFQLQIEGNQYQGYAEFGRAREGLLLSDAFRKGIGSVEAPDSATILWVFTLRRWSAARRGDRVDSHGREIR